MSITDYLHCLQFWPFIITKLNIRVLRGLDLINKDCVPNWHLDAKDWGLDMNSTPDDIFGCVNSLNLIENPASMLVRAQNTTFGGRSLELDDADYEFGFNLFAMSRLDYTELGTTIVANIPTIRPASESPLWYAYMTLTALWIYHVNRLPTITVVIKPKPKAPVLYI